MEYWEKVVSEVARTKPRVRKMVVDTIIAIIAASEAYRSWGEGFSFDKFPELNEKVDTLLIGLSDECKKDAEKQIREILSWMDFEINDDSIIEDVESDDKGIVWAFDMHCSNLKKLLGAWLAISFTEGWTRDKTLAQVLAWMNKPEASPMWREAIRKRVIDPNEGKFGRGYERNIIDALTLTEQGTIYHAFILASAWGYELDGAIGVIVHRGSDYDCPLCDSFTGRVWPLDQIPIPAHPRCVCYLEPVFAEED